MTENVEKIITFVARAGKKPQAHLWTKTVNSYNFQLFTVVKLELTIRTEQHLSITMQYVRELRSQDRRVAQSVPNISYK